MVVVAAADQIAEFRPSLKSGKRDVRPDETLALIVHEGGQLGALLRIERDVSVAHEENRVDVRQARAAACRLPGRHQRLSGNDVRIGGDVGGVDPGFVAEAFDDGPRGWRESMLWVVGSWVC